MRIHIERSEFPYSSPNSYSSFSCRTLSFVRIYRQHASAPLMTSKNSFVCQFLGMKDSRFFMYLCYYKTSWSWCCLGYFKAKFLKKHSLALSIFEFYVYFICARPKIFKEVSIIDTISTVRVWIFAILGRTWQDYDCSATYCWQNQVPFGFITTDCAE